MLTLRRGLANDGHDTRALQLWLGHNNIQHTVRYTELSAARFRRFGETDGAQPAVESVAMPEHEVQRMSVLQFGLDSEIGMLVVRIRGLHQLYEQTISEVRSALDGFEGSAPSEELLRRADYWQTQIAHDSCVRLRLIIENNFHFIETLGLLATVRYVFELLIWLRLGTAHSKYALAYYGVLLKKRCEETEGMVRQLEREIALLNRLDARDEQSIVAASARIREEADRLTAEDIKRLVVGSRLDVDREAARTFSLYAERGKTLGFGYAAHLVRTQALPKAIEQQQAASTEFDKFLAWCPTEAKALLARKWKWDREAGVAEVDGAYDFLYSYVSRLLHATPASITRESRNLEASEIAMFLRYLHGALLDALDLVGKLRARSTVQ